MSTPTDTPTRELDPTADTPGGDATPSATPGNAGDHAGARRGRRILIIVLAVAAILLCLIGGGLAWNHHLDTQAREAYTAAITAHNAAVDSLGAALSDAQTTMDDSENAVADEQTRTDLQDLIDQADRIGRAGVLNPEEATRGQLDDAAQAATDQAGAAAVLADKLTAQVQVVKGSMDEFAIQEAKDGLQDDVDVVKTSADTARAAIDASAGKVADEQVRQDAEASRTAALGAVTKAQELLDADDATADALNTTSSTLRDANTELVAKTKAVTDAQAAWQQAQDSAAAAASAATGASGGSGYAYTSAGSSSGGSGYGGGSSSSAGGGGSSGYPESVTTNDGRTHYQIQPGDDGSYTGGIICEGDCG
jgi:membrane protein involved in colicin uptake